MASNNSANQIISTVEDWFKKLPPLPKGVTEFIAMIMPWIALIFGVIGVLGAIAALGILTVFAPIVAIGGGLGTATNGVIGAALWLVSSALLLMAFPGTNAKKLSGWNLLFWSEAVSLVSSVVFFSVGGVIGVLIGLYILFQIKHHYK